MINTNSVYVIFGTGMSSFSFIRAFNELEILFYLDNNEAKQNTLHNGKPVLSPEVLKVINLSEIKIVIASEYYEEISKQLNEYGLIKDINYFHLKSFLIENTDVFIISYMKCGRTWLRYMLGNFIEKNYSISNDDILSYTDGVKYKEGYPIITSYHDENPHLIKPENLSRNKSEYSDKKIIFVVRDPRDVIVSLYYHLKYRSKEIDDDIDFFAKKIIESIIQYFNIWYKCSDLVKSFIFIRYEDLHNNPEIILKEVISFIGFECENHDDLSETVNESSFNKMKDYEKGNKTQNKQLSSEFSKADEKASKVRKGEIGGYKKELSMETQKFIDEKIKKELNSAYGY